MAKKLYRVQLIKYIRQRGTGRPIQRDDAIVYDFMPVVLGDQFRTDHVLSRMLLREAPVTGPFMLTTKTYETFGKRHLAEREFAPALECYRISLDSRTGFARAMAAIQHAVLLNRDEIAHMDLATDFERGLVRAVLEQEKVADPAAYAEWVDDLRDAYKQMEKLNKKSYGSEEYVEACLAIGFYEEALANARYLKKRKLVSRVLRATPKEILDKRALDKYMDENHPESSMFP